MNAAAARATLAGLIAKGLVERVPVDSEVVGNLLRQAGNHLRTAAAGLEADDPEGAFQLAYDACRKACLALVMATGLRPKGQAAHVITFDAAEAIALNVGAERVVREAADLRFVRHGAEYRAEAVGVQDVSRCDHHRARVDRPSHPGGRKDSQLGDLSLARVGNKE